jgi:transposase
MIHLPASVRVYLCLSPCDMRLSFDGLHALVRDHLQLDAFAGHLYLFASRRKDRLKIIIGTRTDSRYGRNVWRLASINFHPASQARAALKSPPKNWQRC